MRLQKLYNNGKLIEKKGERTSPITLEKGRMIAEECKYTDIIAYFYRNISVLVLLLHRNTLQYLDSDAIFINRREKGQYDEKGACFYGDVIKVWFFIVSENGSIVANENKSVYQK